jgi:hypothetical protein
MSPLELLAPETADAVPFSVRLAARRLAKRAAEAPSDRRVHLRRSARELEWLRSVRLLGGSGYDVRLVDLSEGGALLEVDAPLRPGVTLTLEMSGPGIEAAVPLEVLRCYIASLRGETAVYRGAVAFAHLIEIPGRELSPVAPPPPAPTFVGTDAALKLLVDRCTTRPTGATPGVTLARTDVLQVLDALQTRTSGHRSDVLSRYTSDLLTAVLPALRNGMPREVVAATLKERLAHVPGRWRAQLQQTTARLEALIQHCAVATPVGEPRVAAPSAAVAPDPVSSSATPEIVTPVAGQVRSAFQKIVVRHPDGKLLKGYTQDFHPSRPQFSLWPAINSTPKERVVVVVSRLKAVFFVRDFDGNPTYEERKSFSTRGAGRRIEATFLDGETIVGTTLSYRPDSQGFFVSPADPSANNTRIFVVSSSLRRVRFL